MPDSHYYHRLPPHRLLNPLPDLMSVTHQLRVLSAVQRLLVASQSSESQQLPTQPQGHEGLHLLLPGYRGLPSQQLARVINEFCFLKGVEPPPRHNLLHVPEVPKILQTWYRDHPRQPLARKISDCYFLKGVKAHPRPRPLHLPEVPTFRQTLYRGRRLPIREPWAPHSFVRQGWGVAAVQGLKLG